MELVWLLDRSTALIGYAALYLAVLTGILYNAPGFETVTRTARRIHIEVSVFALIMLLAHGILGVLDTWFVVTGAAPTPAYGTGYMVGGVAVGAGAFLLLIVGVLGFIDARQFQRPWTPRVVHAFTYGGFAFGTIHAAAIGTDLVGLIRPGLIAGTVFLVYVLLLRTLARLGVVSETGTTPSES